MSEPLKPCPFCGGTQNRDLTFNNYGGTVTPDYVVCCSKCGVDGPLFSAGHTKEEAIKAWNERSATIYRTDWSGRVIKEDFDRLIDIHKKGESIHILESRLEIAEKALEKLVSFCGNEHCHIEECVIAREALEKIKEEV